MAEHGIPEDVRHALHRRLAELPRLGRGGDRDAAARRRARSCACATARCACSTAPATRRRTRSSTTSARGIVLGADHLIKHISSNPLISRPLTPAACGAGGGGGGETAERPHALEIYIASLRATQAMDDVDLVLAGHGEPVTDHVALIDERFRLHARRAEKIRRLIAATGPLHGLRDRAVAVGQRRGHAGLPDAVRGARARRPARQRRAGRRAARRRRGAVRRRRLTGRARASRGSAGRCERSSWCRVLHVTVALNSLPLLPLAGRFSVHL